MEAGLSFWEKSCFYERPALTVVGAGIVGLCSAIFFKQNHPNKNVLVIDRELIPKGASTRNAGFACFGSMTELLSDVENQGETITIELVRKRWEGLRALSALVGDQHMEFKKTGGYEVFLNRDQMEYDRVLNKIKTINSWVDPIVGESDTFSVSNHSSGLANTTGIIFNKAEGQLHPGKMMKQLLSICKELDIQIIRGLDVKSIDETKTEVELRMENTSSIFCDQVLVATNGFSQKLFPNLDLKPARNQVMITSPIPGLKLNGCYHYDQGYVYFRNVGNRVLLGGGRNWDEKTAETNQYGGNESIRQKLREFMSQIILPKVKWEIEQEWSGILGVGNQKKPIIKRINNRVAVAIRLGGMGVAIGCSVGKTAAAMMREI